MMATVGRQDSGRSTTARRRRRSQPPMSRPSRRHSPLRRRTRRLRLGADDPVRQSGAQYGQSGASYGQTGAGYGRRPARPTVRPMLPRHRTEQTGPAVGQRARSRNQSTGFGKRAALITSVAALALASGGIGGVVGANVDRDPVPAAVGGDRQGDGAPQKELPAPAGVQAVAAKVLPSVVSIAVRVGNQEGEGRVWSSTRTAPS